MKNSLCRQGLNQAEQEACNVAEDIFETLNNKFKYQYNGTVKSLQYCKINRHNSENVEEWIERLRIAAFCKYQEHDSWVKEQFIHGLNDGNVLREISQELTFIKDTSKVTNNWILMWAT